MKALQKSTNEIIFCLFEIIVGILLLINPIGFATGIIMAAGVVLTAVGVINGVKYFRVDAEEAAAGQYLMTGLMALVAGLFCLIKAQWFIVTFPALTIIYGITVLIAGLGKIQLTVDMLRRKNSKWFLSLISAAISIACAAIILKNPFGEASEILWRFTGVTLIVQALLDIVTLILSSKTARQAAPAEDAPADPETADEKAPEADAAAPEEK